jgi:murein DD-endopeptidase MepM/ murein hydrolase activator NlpD
VRERQRIRRRQVVGEAGATGRVTGPHLHYILRIADKAVDAERYGEAPRADGALMAPSPPPAPTPAPKKVLPKTTAPMPPPPVAEPAEPPPPAPAGTANPPQGSPTDAAGSE